MPASDERRYGRAAFLALLAGGGSAFFWAAKANDVVSPLTSGVSQLLGNLFPVGGWRIYTVSGSMPVFDRRSWRLEVSGLVERPRTFTYRELAALPRVHETRDFHCVTGWTVHGVRWSGARLSHLLELVAPQPSARAVRFTSLEEPYNDSLTLEQARLHDVLLALELDGKPLTRPHGSPVRVVIPEMYGYKGVKWLTKIELLDHQPTGYWEALGYDQDAWVGRSNGCRASPSESAAGRSSSTSTCTPPPPGRRRCS
ncbi:MAG TPA: molybdopterin-dependent oxidoreductase [Gaiellaceae bacterium]|nr:molybdopterin-dependent oxidoreductase [Gaiellaceae bacterium]